MSTNKSRKKKRTTLRKNFNKLFAEYQKDNSEKVLNQLYYLSEEIFRLVSKRYLLMTDGGDIITKSWMMVLKKENFKPAKGEFYNYFYTIMKHFVFKENMREARFVRSLESIGNQEYKEPRQRLDQYYIDNLEEMSEKMQEVILLWVLQEFSNAEIERLINVRENNLKARMFLLRKNENVFN